MGKISSYPLNSNPNTNDYLVGNQASGPNTNRFKFGDILTSFFKSSNLKNDYKFSAYRNSSFSVGNGANLLVTFDTVEYDTGSNYSVSTGKFTAPITGYYHFQASIQYLGVPDVAIVITGLCKNSTTSEIKRLSECLNGGNGNITQNGGADLQLAANDYVCITSRANDGSGGTGPVVSYFSGFLISGT